MIFIYPVKYYTKTSSYLEYHLVNIKVEWKELYFKGLPTGYMISNTGKVKKPDGSKSPLYYDKNGYTRFSLYIPKNHPVFKNEKRFAYHYKVHRAVAELFINNPNPNENTIVMHKNDIPDCNLYVNLKWGSPQDNMDDKKLSGRSKYLKGEEKVEAIFTEQQVREICDIIYNKGITKPKDIIDCLQLNDINKSLLKSYKILINNIKKKHCWKYIIDEFI